MAKNNENNQAEVKLTDMYNNEDLESIVGRSISIAPEQKSYDRKYFVDHAGDYFDLRDYHATLNERNGDVGAMNNISYLLHPTNPRLLLNRGSEGILIAADVELSESGKNLAKYTDNRKLDEKLDEKQLDALLMRIGHPEDTLLYKTDDKSHERLAELVKKRAIIMARKQELLVQDIPELMENAPAWHKVIFNRYAEDQSYIADFLSSYTRTISRVYGREFGKEVIKEGEKRIELDKDKLYKFYRENIQVVEDAIKNEPDEKKKESIWDKSLKPIHLTTTEIIYNAERRKEKEEEQEKEEERKKQRRAKGIRE